MSESNSAETGKSMDRENGVGYKRRSDFKSNFKSATDDEDGDSAPSLKASSNPPLPELQRDKRKLIIKPFNSLQPRTAPAFVEKEVRQHQNILLKQRNNLLASQNLKLKTRITVLERQNQRLLKSTESEVGQAKPSTSYGNNRERLKPNDASLRAVIRGLRREIEDLKKQNLNIKSAVKFTSLKELENERDHLAEQTIRLRLALEEEQSRRTFLKTNVQGVSSLEHKVQHLTDKNGQLMRELNQAVEKCKKMEEGAVKAQRVVDNDRKNAKALQSALLQIREKESEIQQLKSQLKTSHSIPSTTLLQQQTPKQNKFDLKRPSIERKPKPIISQVKPISQKSPTAGGCQKCSKLQSENKMLLDKIKKLEIDIEKSKGSYGQLPRGPIAQVREEQVLQLKRFLTLRFKAHRLSYQQSEKYLINCEGNMKEGELAKSISVRQLMESLFVQPFCIVSNRYLEVLISRLAFSGVKGAVSIDDNLQVKKGSVVDAYRKLLPRYEVMTQEKEEEMFIQVAELITTYYQQILAALTAKRNGEGTIAEKSFLQFFAEIQLEQEYTDFIITQIILESLDMEHLNFFAMFEIFYMPQMATNASSNPNTQKKKKFEVQQIVHQEDEEYEESKSHVGSRNKTLEHKQKEEGQADYEWSEDKANVENEGGSYEKGGSNEKADVKPVAQITQKVQQQYGEQFQQERQQ